MSRLEELARRLREREGLYKDLIVAGSVVAVLVTSLDNEGNIFGGQENTFLIATILTAGVAILWVLTAVVGGRR